MPGLPKLVQHLADYVWKYLGSKWNQTFFPKAIFFTCTHHKAESLQIRGAANTIIRMRNLDSLPTACRKPELLKVKCKTGFQTQKGRDAVCTYASEIGTVKMNRPRYQNA